MQLNNLLWCFLSIGWFFSNLTLAQNEVGLNKYNIGEIELDFLSSYYQQDGENGAVLGGTGSQALSDQVFAISLNVPIDSQYIFGVKISFDTYTSASSSMIDPDGPLADALMGKPMPISGASYKDQRTYGNLSFTRLLTPYKTYTLGIGFSSEYDVTSFSVNGNYSIESKNKNTGLQFNIVGLYDIWSLIYPVELRPLETNQDTLLDINNRQTISSSLILSHIFTKKFQSAIIYEYTLQNGLLSTPFHRVIFNDGLLLDDANKAISIEQLPNVRNKHAFALRSAWYPFNSLIIRNFARYYFDSFGIESYTAEIETPIKITRFFSVYPFYRYYSQNASDYFKPFNSHSTESEYYTSDYDLSGFYSQKAGIGIRLSPPFGLYSISHTPLTLRRTTIKGFNIRGGLYKRSNGLSSFFVSADFSLTF